MPQPPVLPIMARALSRSVPFVCVRTFNGILGIGGNVGAEFDTLATFADPNQFNQVAAFPSGLPATHAVGPWLDALVFCDVATSLRVEYAVDRGCAYRQPTPDIAIAGNVPENIAMLRITGRFVRVTLINATSATVDPPARASTVTEFGIYVRSV